MPRTRSTASLKRAVQDIPSLIMQEQAQQTAQKVTKLPVHKVSPTHKHRHGQIYHSPIASRRYMMIGIIGCIVIIGGFWLVYMSNLVRSHGFSLTSASALTMAPRDEFEAVIASFSVMEDQIRQNIKSKQDIEIMVSDALEPLLALAVSQEHSTSTDAHIDNESSTTTTTSTAHIGTDDPPETTASSTTPVHTE